MRDPLEDLDLGAPFDDRMKKRIIQNPNEMTFVALFFVTR
ncbi:MAG: hypothetical protein BWY45_02536 [Euryarchaeota archaeon ADurb.Bin294]|jgi:hypothetical protein|nr:MAG: hypothetical protein BWY45_02536 [Euryarchaeota archaeon ADurb.Bin294]